MIYIKLHGGNFNVRNRDVREGLHGMNELSIIVCTCEIHDLNELSVNGLNELLTNVHPHGISGMNELSVNGMDELTVNVFPRDVKEYRDVTSDSRINILNGLNALGM